MATVSGNTHTQETKSTNSESPPATATSTNASMTTTSEPEEIINIFFEADLYHAAKEGNFDTLKNSQVPLQCLVTPSKSTILHIHLAAILGDDETKSAAAAQFVKKVLENCPSLLSQPDANGDIPLHIAARNGCKNIVDIVIEQAKAAYHVQTDPESGEGSAVKTLLMMTNTKKDTTLHEAARNNHADVAKVFIENDPDLLSLINDRGETPLYLAAEGGHRGVVHKMVEKCTKLEAYQGPEGKTALHAAVLAYDPGLATNILKKEKSLAQKKDDKGWTPLHYAAYMGYSMIVTAILKTDPSVAYSVDKARKMTALHLAACQSEFWPVLDIISRCSDCCRLVDTRGWNALHHAAVSKSDSVGKLILEKKELRYLTEQKDIKGNTPIHLLVATHPKSHIGSMYGSSYPNLGESLPVWTSSKQLRS